MYEIWYIPRIEDELVVARFDTEEQAKSAMADLKDKRPKAYPHHYIWDSKNKVKIEERSIWPLDMEY